MIWVEGSEARQVEQPHLQDVRENVLLHVCIVHSDGAATDLDAIQDEVVMLPAYLSACFPIPIAIAVPRRKYHHRHERARD